jgi:FtsZ-binding cell division protein ZapB
MESGEAVKIIAPIVTAFLGGGVLVALIQRPKTQAQAQHETAAAEGIKIHGQLELVDRTMDLNKLLLERLDRMDKDISDHKDLIETLRGEVASLKEENGRLKSRCKHLEDENERLRRRDDDMPPPGL